MKDITAAPMIKRKNKVLAIVLGFCFLGFGIFYLGLKRGLTMTMASIIVIIVFYKLPEALTFLSIFINFGCAYYAYREVDVINGVRES